jgi:YVTN family beta-propeller protein
VGHQPNSVAVGQQSILVTNECDGTVSRIDPATNRVVETIELGHHPRDVAVRGGFAWLEVAKDVYFDIGTCP